MVLAVLAGEIVPEIARCESLRDHRVLRLAIERQECGLRAADVSCHVSRIVIDREVDEAAFPKRLASISLAILRNRMLHVLTGEMVFQFDGDNRQTIQEQDDINRLVRCLGREMDLAYHSETVAFVLSLMFRVAAGGRFEEGELHVDAIERHAAAQHFQRATFLNNRRDLPRECLPFRSWKLFAELGPLFGLRRLHERREFLGIEQRQRIERRARSLTRHRPDRQCRDDEVFQMFFRQRVLHVGCTSGVGTSFTAVARSTARNSGGWQIRKCDSYAADTSNRSRS